MGVENILELEAWAYLRLVAYLYFSLQPTKISKDLTRVGFLKTGEKLSEFHINRTIKC